ncbi:hypothetical protein DVH24_026578 [Malus domestica]|uniref:PGG domain-containing protein n=1 Tax=Malus domestica TaxID=3750 RepID=A0A498KSE2_MALDO|nr:hypothetical protein DVH24_026578 [Malus domestica]
MNNTGKTFNEKDKRRNTALHVAVENNHQDVAMFLVGEDGSGSTSHSTNNFGKTPLCMAAETANLKLVKAMVDKTPSSTADTNSGNFWQGSNGNSILRSAIIRRKQDLLETILRKMNSADLINSTDQGWMSPLTLAAYMDNFVAVRILLQEFLADKGDENQLLPIHVASKKAIAGVSQSLPRLEGVRDHEGRNILHLAAMYGRVDVVRYIIGKRDLQVLSKQRDQSGNTPLHIAVQNCHPKIVKILSLFDAYERGNLNSLNDAGETALDLAEKTGVDKEMLFRRKLTLMALNLANAPRSEEQTVSKETQDSVPKSLHNSDNPMFSKECVNTLLLVSTLVVGITFAQGFTVPGGYSDSGTPIFLQRCLFQIFLICNTVAMCGSITASIALMWAQTYDPSIIYATMRFTLPVLGVTLTMMSSSFLAGVALTVYHVSWLRIFVYAMGLSFTVFLVGLLAPLIDLPVSYETILTRAILFFCFDLLMFVSGYN